MPYEMLLVLLPLFDENRPRLLVNYARFEESLAINGSLVVSTVMLLVFCCCCCCCSFHEIRSQSIAETSVPRRRRRREMIESEFIRKS